MPKTINMLRLSLPFAFISLVGALSGVEKATGWHGFPDGHKPAPDSARQTCVVEADPYGRDDGPAIVDAFERCKQNSHIILPSDTYHISSPMNTTDLSDVVVDLQGTMIVSFEPSGEAWGVAANKDTVER